MMVIDSSVWIALFNELDSQHQKAVGISASFAYVALPEYIALETCTLLLAKAGSVASEKFLAYALDSTEVTLLYSSPDFFQSAVRLFRHLSGKMSGKSLSFVDVSLLLLAQSHEVITFDKALSRAIKARA